MASERSGRLIIVPDLEAATSAALACVLSTARAALTARGRFTVALSGGNTPRGLYTHLAGSSAASELAWDRVELFFGDERGVPPEDPESNYGMVKDALIDHVRIPDRNVHRIRAELGPEAAAVAYAADLSSSFHLTPGEMPRFDLVLLGMGPDGHTASLFPHTEALAVHDRLAVANRIPQLRADRITLTLPVLNAAREVLLLVTGADKAEALAQVLEGQPDPERLPSQSIRPAKGRLTWLVDRAAASRLSPRRADP